MKRTFLFDTLPSMQCHASNLLISSKGTRIAAFFAGTRESDPDTSIWFVTGNGKNWSPPRVMVKNGFVPHWNPVLIEAKGELSLYFKTGMMPSLWKTYHMTLGKNSDMHPIFDSHNIARGPVRSSILIDSGENWLAPASHEVIVKPSNGFSPPVVVWDAFLDRSEDQGKTWHRTPFLEYDRDKFGKFGGVIQPTIWESKPGHIHMLLRSTIGKVCRSDSTDFGKTWSPVEDTYLPNNNSGIDVVKNPKTGVVALVYNPVGTDWGARTPISVAFANDPEGRTWSDPVAIESGFGSFSYPSIRPLDEGFALTYTWNRTRIAYLEFSVDNLESDIDSTFNTDIEEVDLSMSD